MEFYIFTKNSVLLSAITGDPLLSPLHHLRHRLPPAQAEFFVLLDADLEKVDSFYRKQEKELRERGNSLRAQLDSLLAHRQGVYVGVLTTLSLHAN